MAKGDRTQTRESIYTPEEARLRLREAGIEAEGLDDATALLREKALREEQQEQAINDLIRKHTPRKIIGAPEPEELSVEEKIEVLQLIGEDEFIAAHLDKDPTKLTPKDRAEFERRSGHDAVIEAVLGTPLSELSSLQLAQARSALRNADFEARITGRRQPGGSTQEDPTPPPSPTPGAGTGSGSGSGSGTEPGDPGDPGGAPPDSNPTGNDGPEPPPPDAGPPPDDDPGTDQVTGDSDPVDTTPPPGGDDPTGDPTDGEVISGSDDPEGPPPEGEGSGGGSGTGSGSTTGGASSGGGGSTPPDAAPPEDTEETGGFDYYGPTNPSGQYGQYHRDEDGTWTDANGDEVTNPTTVASLEHQYGEYRKVADNPPPEDTADEPEPDDDEDEPDEDEPDEDEPDEDEPDEDEEEEPEPAPDDEEEPPPDEGSSVEFTPSGDEGAPLPEDIQQQLNRDFASLRRLRGGDGGDGVTDPADDAGFEVRDPSVQLPTHAELGMSLFGQPPIDGVETGGGGGNFNPGANPHGGGVTDPTDEQTSFDGPQRDDDPLAGPPEIEPPPAEAEAEDPGEESVFLPRSQVVSRVDDGPELPDDVTIQDPD